MKRQEYLTIPQLAKILGISRIAVYKKVRSGKIKARKIGRSFAIRRDTIGTGTDKAIIARDKRRIDAAVRDVVREYGETLRLLGRE